MTEMLQWKRLLATVFVVLALLAIAVMPVMADVVSSPCSGTVTIDGSPAPDTSGVRVYVGAETAPRKETATVGGLYEAFVVGDESDVGKALSFKVREAGETDWRDATSDPPSPTFAYDDPQVVDLFASTGPIIWNCPRDHLALIAPYPANDRPFLTASANLSDVIYDVEWFQVLWLNEGTGGWLTYYSDFTIGNTLTTLDPDQYYYVIVSEPCELEIP